MDKSGDSVVEASEPAASFRVANYKHALAAAPEMCKLRMQASCIASVQLDNLV